MKLKMSQIVDRAAKTRLAIVQAVTGYGSVLIGAAMLFTVVGVANASQPEHVINPLISPIIKPIIVKLNCGDQWNPTCQPVATTTNGAAIVASRFTIDEKLIGPANAVYTNVCASANIRDGRRSARLYAKDAEGNIAQTTAIIRCDRTPPVVSVSQRDNRWWKILVDPRAEDKTSGVASRAFIVDDVKREWQTYANVCGQLKLTVGAHKASVTATDYAGNNAKSETRQFYCMVKNDDHNN